MGQNGRWEYFRAIYARYHQADRKLKQVILKEFFLDAHYNRKYAIRLPNGPPLGAFARVAGPVRADGKREIRT